MAYMASVSLDQEVIFIGKNAIIIITSFSAPATPARKLGLAGRPWGRFAPQVEPCVNNSTSGVYKEYI